MMARARVCPCRAAPTVVRDDRAGVFRMWHNLRNTVQAEYGLW